MLTRTRKPLDFTDNTTSSAALLGIDFDSLSKDARLHLGDLEHDGVPESMFTGDAIEDLLSAVGNRQDLPPTTTNEDPAHTQSLLDAARDIVQRPRNDPHDRGQQPATAVEIEDDSSDENAEEEEAARYVEQLLEQLSSEPQEPPLATADKAPEPEGHGAASTRQKQHPIDEDELASRLTALNLPSVPSETPGSAKAKGARRGDDSAPDCCCICYDNATTKCLDCEGDQLFCVRCWWEMHMEDGSDWELQRHRSVKYQR